MNIQKMLKEAQRMQQRMTETQEELASQSVEGTAGGGKVTVVANGAGEIQSIKIDPQIVDPSDVDFLQELILAAVQDAVAKAKELSGSAMSKITGNLPGLGGLF